MELVSYPRDSPSELSGDLRRLTAVNDRYEAAVAAGDIKAVHRQNDLFHTESFRVCGNDLLLQLVKHCIGPDLRDPPRRLRRSRRSRDITRHHRIMLELLTGTDPWALAQICVDYIQPTRALHLEMLRRQESGGVAR